ncbi:hypothetical protein ABFS83_14G072100 [Erythranthe nasuta]
MNFIGGEHNYYWVQLREFLQCSQRFSQMGSRFCLRPVIMVDCCHAIGFYFFRCRFRWWVVDGGGWWERLVGKRVVPIFLSLISSWFHHRFWWWFVDGGRWCQRLVVIGLFPFSLS